MQVKDTPASKVAAVPLFIAWIAFFRYFIPTVEHFGAIMGGIVIAVEFFALWILSELYSHSGQVKPSR